MLLVISTIQEMTTAKFIGLFDILEAIATHEVNIKPGVLDDKQHSILERHVPYK